MKLTVDSDEPLDKVLEVVGSLYGVRLSVAGAAENGAATRVGRRSGAAARRRPAKKATSKSATGRGRRGAADPALVRAWARENGLDVRARGRVPADIVAAYKQSAGRRR